MAITDKRKRHKLMERAIRSLMSANLPPRFKFKDTYDSIEVPAAYTQHLPTQQEIEDKFDELETQEEAVEAAATEATVISKFDSVITSNLEVGTSNLFVDTETGRVGVGTNSPDDKLDVDGNIKHQGLTMSAGTDIDQITIITKSLRVTTAWMDTGIKSTDLVTGTYIVQIYNVDDHNVGGSNYDETYSGLMSWYDGNTNSTESTEILLTAAGHAPNDNHIYLRVQRTVSADTNDLKLQIRKDSALTSAYTYTFKFRRII